MDEMAVIPADAREATETALGPGDADLAGGRRSGGANLAGRTGLLPRQEIRTLVHRKVLRATQDLEEGQFQPASLDLRLGARAYRVRASFLPGPNRTVEEKLAELKNDVIDLDHGAILEKGCVYVVELIEHLDLPDSIAALANPKSSTGRLDVFTRLISDRSEVFDSIAGGYRGRLYAEISPRSFSVKVRKGSRLNQIRFRRRNSQQHELTEFRLSDRELRELHGEMPLVDGDLQVRNGLMLHIELGGIGRERLVGYRAQRHTDLVDVDRVGEYRFEDFWETVRARDDRRLILDPNEFYILASKERLHIPAHLAAEMVPIDPLMGEFRVHYAGFFDPGFGQTPQGPGSRAVLEVRSHEVPFILDDGQMVCRLAYEKMAAEPDGLYGQIGTSNYQGQELKLSKHFRLDG
jgi:dCTP deaminase